MNLESLDLKDLKQRSAAPWSLFRPPAARNKKK